MNKKVCIYKNCKTDIRLVRGYCRRHYALERYYGNLQRIMSKGHNLSATSEYRSWSSMKTRCLNPNHKYYGLYGGAGIKVWRGWVNDFISFYEYMGKKPTIKHSLDRINSRGHYEPGNVRWATQTEQVRGRTRRFAKPKNGHFGVYFSKKENRWKSQISRLHKTFFISSSTNFERACDIRDLAEGFFPKNEIPTKEQLRIFRKQMF